jgi:hypothetical protein
MIKDCDYKFIKECGLKCNFCLSDDWCKQFNFDKENILICPTCEPSFKQAKVLKPLNLNLFSPHLKQPTKSACLIEINTLHIWNYYEYSDVIEKYKINAIKLDVDLNKMILTDRCYYCTEDNKKHHCLKCFRARINYVFYQNIEHILLARFLPIHQDINKYLLNFLAY